MKQEARDKRHETRSKKQEAGSKRHEAGRRFFLSCFVLRASCFKFFLSRYASRVTRRVPCALRLKSQSGIALMMVLGAIVVLTSMAIEFAYNTNVNYHLAQNERDRLKALYLAKSAYKFMQVELKYDRLFAQVIQSQNLGQFLGANANLPLCQQFPMSTALIRAVFLGGEGAENLPSDLKTMVSVSQESGAKEFLEFEGDFDAECIDESTKIDLNYFSGLNPMQRVEEGYNAYDKYKIFLIKFLSVGELKKKFEDLNIKIEDVVRNIADWIDTNERINEMSGVEAGPEMSIYDRFQKGYPVKNGKLTTLEEVYLIDGVDDSWFVPLENYFTVYSDGLVNVCSSEDYVIAAVISRYVEDNPNLPPIKLDDLETLTKLISAVKEGCSQGGTGSQLKQQITTSLNNAIGAIGGIGQTGQGRQPGRGTAAGGAGFGSLITTEKRFFTLLLTGSVGDTSVRIKTVLDVKEMDPKKWKILYWRVY